LRSTICVVGVALAVVFGATAADAKPLYITVNRAFTPKESPVVDVAFMGKEPVELRVLKPKDLERYIAGQENLRRSWERPETQENPGRALSLGFNAMRAPGRYLLLSLNPEMRKALGSTVAARGEEETATTATMAEGPQKLVDVPSDMNVVSRQWLNLDLGGDPRSFDVPGFEGWSRTSSGFEERRVKLKPMAPGIYVLQLVQGTIEGQVVLVVTDLTMQVKQTDGTVLVRVADSQTQSPVPDAKVVVRQRGQKPITGKTNSQGEVMLSAKEPKLVVTAHRDAGGVADVAVIDTDFYSTLAVRPDVFLYSDRPIYKPGDEVQFRGIVRKPDGFLARVFAPAKRAVTVSLVPVSGVGKARSMSLNVDEMGSFSGSLAAPDDATEGVYRITAMLDDGAHVGEVRVQEYVKPTFFLELKTASDSVAPGGVITATVKAERYSGGAPLNTAFEVTLTRSALESPTWVDDAGLGGEGSAVTYGSASTTEGKLSVPDRLYSSLTERLEAGTADYSDTWKSANTFDDDGNAEITVTVPALKAGEERNPYTYTLSVRARDDQGTFAGASKALYLSPVDVMGTLRLSTKVAKLSATPKLVIRSTSLAGKATGKTNGTVAFVLRTARGDERALSNQSFVTDDDGVARVDVPASDVGAVYARVTLKDQKGAEWTGEERLIVVGDNGEAVEWVPELSLTTLASVVSPGDSAQIIALLPEEWGQGGTDAGPLWVTLSGTTIFSTRVLQAKGRTVVIPVPIEKRFGSAVYVSVGYPTRSGRWSERTLPLRIIPAERVLQVRATATRAEVAPLGEQSIRLKVTDHNGRGVSAQISVGVVDKAVYAVQPEFRPGVLDFFYPLVRNNVADFFSAEFQGYGYGHVLARALGLGGVQFAMVKPPKKKTDERDTAYWNGNVVTDDTGSATVTFPMPSNQTLWTITAVAADAKGRVGEGRGQFASRGKALVHLSAPEFLREGDEATARLRIQSGADSTWQGTANVVVGASTGALSASLAQGALTLGEAREASTNIQLKGASAGRADLSLSVTGTPQPLKEQRSVDVEARVVVDDVAASVRGGGTVTLPGPKSARFTDVELVLQGGVTDAIFSDVRQLLIYPHGCLEQLVATTTPPLSLALALESQGSTLDAENAMLLSEARSRAASGVQRIMGYAAPGGGFSWFPGGQASLEMTLLALGGLAPAQKAGLLPGRQAVIGDHLNWLEAQGGLSPFFESMRAQVLAQFAPERAKARARAALAGAGDDVIAGAVAVLAADAAGVADEASSANLVNAIATKASAAVVAGNVPENADDAWRFPMRGAGHTAILAHAALVGGASPGPLKNALMARFADEGLSTLDRATLVLHSLPFVAAEQKAQATMTPPKVDAAGRDGGAATFVARGSGLVAALKDGTSTVTVGAFDGIATVRARRAVPLADAPALTDGFGIERRYWSVGSGAKTPLAPGAAVAQGDVVWVQLNIDLKGERQNRSAYSVVEDFIPAGFSPLREDKIYRAEPLALPLAPPQQRQRIFSPRSVRFYLEEPTWWMGSPREVGYVMRADFAGTFVAPPATVSDMYNENAAGRTTSETLTISPSSNAK
jgi:uncharacterized protein YfaS (alpha-2-macroglobulin family)